MAGRYAGFRAGGKKKLGRAGLHCQPRRAGVSLHARRRATMAHLNHHFSRQSSLFHSVLTPPCNA
tara:strand:- start:671 stop:865 length:195 start_codon:yes stop_codon:yes gene_type:complete